MISSAAPQAAGIKAQIYRFRFSLLAGLSILVFLGAGVLLLPLLGFEADEVMYVYDLWHPRSSVAWFSFFHHVMPSMLMSYLGALKSWLYAPILAVFGPSTWAVRLPVLLLACLTICLAGRLLKSIDGRMAALIGIWLLATDMTFLLTAVFDWGPVVIQNFLLVTGLLIIDKWTRQRRPRLLFFAGLIFGLALWDKALFLWNFAGMAVALVGINARALMRALTWKAALLAVLGLCLGAYPLLRYNAKPGHSTVGQNAHLTTAEISNKARYLWYAGNDGIAATFFVDPKYPALDRSRHPFENSSLAVAGKTVINLSSWRSWLVVFAIPLGLIAADKRRRKWILFFAIAATISWLQSAITVNAGGAIHHSVLVWPLIYLAVSLSLATIAARNDRLLRPLVIIILIVFCFRGLLVINRSYANMLTYSPIVQWSDADSALARTLERGGIRRVIVTDWGLAAVIAARTNDRVSVEDESWQLLDGHYDQGAFSECRAPECIVISHAPGRAVMEKAATNMNQALTARHLRESDVSLISDTHGTPTFQTFRIEEPPSGE